MSQGQDWVDAAMGPLRGLASKHYNAIYVAVGALGQSAGPRLAQAVAALLAEPVRVLEERVPSGAARPDDGDVPVVEYATLPEAASDLEWALREWGNPQKRRRVAHALGVLRTLARRIGGPDLAVKGLAPSASDAVTDGEVAQAVRTWQRDEDIDLSDMDGDEFSGMREVLTDFLKRRTQSAGLPHGDGE
jgi:hypothetical protein